MAKMSLEEAKNKSVLHVYSSEALKLVKSYSFDVNKGNSFNVLIWVTLSMQNVLRIETRIFICPWNQNTGTKRSLWVVVHTAFIQKLLTKQLRV